MMLEETLDGAVEGVDPEIEMVGQEAMGSLDQEAAEDDVTAQSATAPDALAELAVSESGVPEAGAGEAEGSDAGESDVEDVTDQEPEADEAEAEEAEVVQRPEGTAWYVVHSYSGYENKVRKNLEHRIESMGMQDQIFQVIVPTEEEVELRDGQRRTTERRVFPGYILVEMLLNDDTWHAVRNTPGVTDFVRSGDKPVPLRPEEVDKILRRMEAGAPKIKVRFREGQQVRIIEGPFEDFIGTVDVIDADRARVRVLVSMFGRETPVEVDFLQVERV
jgi:transcriptional antiterminator NusG